jgi:hypothetical protein
LRAFGSAETIGVAGAVAGLNAVAVPTPGLAVKGAGPVAAPGWGTAGTAGTVGTTTDELGGGTGVRATLRCGGIGGNGGGCRRLAALAAFVAFVAFVLSESAGIATARPSANARHIRRTPPWSTFIKIGRNVARCAIIDEEKLLPSPHARTPEL